jgi:F-type H+-transporting ATPase subunit delta
VASTSGNQEIARRYATALFELAKEQNALDKIAADLQALGNIIAESKDFVAFIGNISYKRAEQGKAIAAIAEGAKLSPLTKNFLGLLAAKRRLGALPEIIAAVQAAIDAHKGETTAEVISAQALDKGQADSIATALKKALGLNVRLKLTQDPSIMGGLVVRVGSMLVDSSVRTKLERLTRALKSSDQSKDKTKMKEVA